MRLIDADALIKDHGDDVTNWGNPCAVTIKSIQEAPTIDTFRWIPVTERLPEHGERVLAYSPAMRNTTAEIQASKGFMVRRKRTDITHWMPLPDAPKEEN